MESKKPINKADRDYTSHFELTGVESAIWELHKQGKKRAEIAELMSLKPQSVARRLLTIREKVMVQ